MDIDNYNKLALDLDLPTLSGDGTVYIRVAPFVVANLCVASIYVFIEIFNGFNMFCLHDTKYQVGGEHHRLLESRVIAADQAVRNRIFGDDTRWDRMDGLLEEYLAPAPYVDHCCRKPQIKDWCGLSCSQDLCFRCCNYRCSTNLRIPLTWLASFLCTSGNQICCWKAWNCCIHKLFCTKRWAPRRGHYVSVKLPGWKNRYIGRVRKITGGQSVYPQSSNHVLSNIYCVCFTTDEFAQNICYVTQQAESKQRYAATRYEENHSSYAHVGDIVVLDSSGAENDVFSRQAYCVMETGLGSDGSEANLRKISWTKKTTSEKGKQIEVDMDEFCDLVCKMNTTQDVMKEFSKQMSASKNFKYDKTNSRLEDWQSRDNIVHPLDLDKDRKSHGEILQVYHSYPVKSWWDKKENEKIFLDFQICLRSLLNSLRIFILLISTLLLVVTALWCILGVFIFPERFAPYSTAIFTTGLNIKVIYGVSIKRLQNIEMLMIQGIKEKRISNIKHQIMMLAKERLSDPKERKKELLNKFKDSQSGGFEEVISGDLDEELKPPLDDFNRKLRDFKSLSLASIDSDKETVCTDLLHQAQLTFSEC